MANWAMPIQVKNADANTVWRDLRAYTKNMNNKVQEQYTTRRYIENEKSIFAKTKRDQKRQRSDNKLGKHKQTRKCARDKNQTRPK